MNEYAIVYMKVLPRDLDAGDINGEWREWRRHRQDGVAAATQVKQVLR